MERLAAWFLIVTGSSVILLAGLVVVPFRLLYRFRWDRTGRKLSRGIKHGGRPFNSSAFQESDIRELRRLDPSAAETMRDYVQRFREMESTGRDPFIDTRRFLRFLDMATYVTAGLVLLGAAAVVVGTVWLRAS